MTRRWTTPVIWLAFTALATIVGLVSVSVVRHAVVATSLRPTSASDVAAVLGSSRPTPTLVTTLPTPTQSATQQPRTRPTTPPTKPPVPVVLPTAIPTPTPTHSPPTTGPSAPPSPSPKSAVISQPYPQGVLGIRCQSSGVQVVYAWPRNGYQVQWQSTDVGSVDFTFHPADGNDSGQELSVSVSCSHGIANWSVRD